MADLYIYTTNTGKNLFTSLEKLTFDKALEQMMKRTPTTGRGLNLSYIRRIPVINGKTQRETQLFLDGDEYD